MRRLFLLVLVLLIAWDVVWALVGVKPLFPWQLEEEYRRQNPDLVLLDVRTRTEYNWFHLPGAENIPFRNLDARYLKVPKNKTVVVICMTGHRSSLVAWHLQKSGYANVYNLTWGMAGWEAYKYFKGYVSQPKGPEPEIKQTSG